MISIENLKVEFGVKPLFQNVGFVINERDRIALVGKNGAGKSTLLKIIAGFQKPTEGSVAIANDTTVGYLPQVMNLQDDTTVREEAHKAFADVQKLADRVAKLERQMAERTDYESEEYAALVERFTTLHDQLMMSGADNCEAELERTLVGLGFLRTDFDRPTREFSGGWRMRIELAKILLRRPDVLLLDEPTNHLDIESIQWLEQWLANCGGAVVLVSHDRAFINNVTNRTIEISCGRINDYRVKYDEFVALRAERREQQLRAYENQQKEIADIKDFIERFRYKPTKAVQVQQRIRQLEKIVPIEVDEVDNSALRLKFPPCLRSGDYPIICEEVSKTYYNPTPSLPTGGGGLKPDSLTIDKANKNIPSPSGEDQGGVPVFHNVNLTIKRGEKVAFVGKNGEGKSTLVKCILGEIPFDGNLKVGHNIQIGYFAQNQAQLLDENLSVFETIDNVARGEIRLRINDILGAFMFGGETADKKVKVLSGGERSRLAMIRLLLEPVNLLILDEPTNHLDMVSKDVLKEAIRAFDGTAIIVSHDREFLDGLVSKVFEFGGGLVKEHFGGIYDFLQSKKIATLDELGGDSSASRNNVISKSRNNETKPQNSKPQSDQKTLSPSGGDGGRLYFERKELQKRINKLEKQIKEAESTIEKLEQREKELNDTLMDPAHASDMTLVNEYTALSEKLQAEIARWETLSLELEELKS